MQSDVDHILQTASGLSFEGRKGAMVQLDLATGRNFKESSAERILLVGPRRWERGQDSDTGARIYDGYWIYPVYIYVPANPRDHLDYSDFEEAAAAANAFLSALLPDSAWEFSDQSIYEAQMSSRELVVAEIEIKVFATRRFL